MTNSATHLGFLELLGELDKVTGVCNSNYIYNPTILQGVKDGTIKDLGDAFNLEVHHSTVNSHGTDIFRNKKYVALP